MQPKRSFSLPHRIRSFKHAFHGLAVVLQSQHNARIHAASTAAILILSYWLQIGKIKFALILLAITCVWVTECFNTVFEILTTIASPSYSAKAKRAKDVAAGAVLTASIAAVAIGIMLLGPPLIQRFHILLH